MICPKCGEVNSANFRFCGMCGTLLETRPEIRPESRRPAGAPVPGLPNVTNSPAPPRPAVVESPARPPDRQAAPISGSSFGGSSFGGSSLSGSSLSGSSFSGSSLLGLNQPGATQPNQNQPSMESLREKSFSGLDSFFEPEEPKGGGRRVLLLLVLLAALGAAGWWTYTNYLGATESRKPEAATASTGEVPAEKPTVNPATPAPTATPDAGSSQAVVPPAGVPAAPTPARKTAPATGKPETPRIALGDKSAEKPRPSTASAKAPELPEPAAAETGDAAFRKGEAYLYGRGVPENCDEAVKNLKAASAKSNAKARSAFGTMYATGHCVPRDLPTSYLWFALALRVDPNNQILEKDLSAVWNQMTPPERQMATRMKQ